MSEHERPMPGIIPVRATGHSSQVLAAGGVSLKPVEPHDDVDVLAMIGRVAVMSAYIERLLDRMIWQLLKVDPTDGALQTRSIPNLEQRIDKILKLGTEKGVPNALLSRLMELRKTAIDLSEARARIIHDPWYVETDSGRTAQFRAMPKRADNPVFAYVHVSPEDIDRVLQGQVALWNDLAPVHDDIAGLVTP